MKRSLLVLAVPVLLAGLTVSVDSGAYTKEPARWEDGTGPFILAEDCLLSAYNTCSGYIWVISDVPGAVWGVVLDPTDCPAGCANGGAVCDIYLYSRCSSVPGTLNGVRLEAIDAAYCPTSVLYDSGPLSVTHCVAGDRWSHFPVPLVHLNGNPFLLAVEMGPEDPGTGQSNPKLATDDGIANFNCWLGLPDPPTCEQPETCAGFFPFPPQLTFIYVTDFNGDTRLDDLCELYLQPYPFSFPYIFTYGYLPNNLLAAVTLDCTTPTAVEPTSWGRLKALFR